MVSNPEAFSLGGNEPKSNDHFAFHSIRVSHLQFVLEVLVGDSPVVNGIAGLKSIEYTVASSKALSYLVRSLWRTRVHSDQTFSFNKKHSYHMWKDRFFPVCNKQIFLVWFPAPAYPDLTRPNLHKKVFQEKLITSTLSSLTSLERRKSFLLYLQTIVEGVAEIRGSKKGKQEKDRRRKFLHRQSFVPIPLH